ncbi:hypothetical protein [Sphingopyxis terrae]
MRLYTQGSFWWGFSSPRPWRAGWLGGGLPAFAAWLLRWRPWLGYG